MHSIPQGEQKTTPKYTHTQRKKEAEKMAKKLWDIGYNNRGARMMACSNEIVYTRCPQCGKLHLVRTTLCRDRLCSICNYVLTVKRYAEMMDVAARLQPQIDAGYQVGMLTLTIRNCTLYRLSETLDQMAIGYSRLQKRRAWQRIVIGWARSTEITIGKNGTAHPHYHILTIIEPGHTEAEIHKLCKQYWAQSMRLDYAPIIDYRAAYCKKDVPTGDRLQQAIIECSKYVAKGSQILSLSDDRLALYALAIGGRRLVTYGGIIHDIRRNLGYSDDETQGDDVLIDTTCNCGAEIQQEIARWAGTKWVNDDGEVLDI